jgi:hypothetical protein
MSANNSRSKAEPPVVVLHEPPSQLGRQLLRLVPAMVVSVIFHVFLLGVFFVYLLAQSVVAAPDVVTKEKEVNSINAENSVEEKKETFAVVDEDPSATEYNTDIQFELNRKDTLSVPGAVNADEAVGIQDGDKSAPLKNLPAAPGFGTMGQGGAMDVLTGKGNSNAVGQLGGTNLRGMPLEGTFYGRSGATREYAWKNGGGTEKSEAAVARGLKWLVRQQNPISGSWSLHGPNASRGRESNDVAATALGLLPFLAAGKTHKPGKDNVYDKNIQKGLDFLKRSQNPKTGFFGGTMYAHGLATIAMCEAYGLSQDPTLRRYAQAGVTFLVNIQHDEGGWRYKAEKEEGDISVTGWQIMALKSGQMAGLAVPDVTVRKAINFLEICSDKDRTEGYSYTKRGGGGYDHTRTAVGLLCRQYMENWGPSNPRLIKAYSSYIKTNPPGKPEVYYYYYATQVMHHYGGDEWRKWNEAMREYLISKQDMNNASPDFGSWNPAGDQWGGAGGRLMVTSLNLLTLEVYYRYLPLYYRDAGYKMDKAVQNGL